MKRKWFIAGILLIALVVSGLLLKSIGEKKMSEPESKSVSDISFSHDSNVINITEKEQLVLDFIKGKNVEQMPLSNKIKKRVQDQEFAAIWRQDYVVQDIKVWKQSHLKEFQIIIFDVILERNHQYQWLQFKTIFKDEKLVDIVLQPINYLERIEPSLKNVGSQHSSVEFINQVISSLKNTELKNYGWRYQQQNPMMDKAVQSTNVIETSVLGENHFGETLILAKYEVTLVERKQIVEALFYVKSYGEKKQVEDIVVLDVYSGEHQ